MCPISTFAIAFIPCLFSHMLRATVRRIFLLSAFLFAGASIHAQSYEPARGTSDRSQMLDIARQQVRTSGLSGLVEFWHVWMRCSGNWAFMRADIPRPGGGFPPTSYCDADTMIELLLRRHGSDWRIISGEGSETQFCYSDFAGYGWYVENYGAPRSIFPPSPF